MIDKLIKRDKYVNKLKHNLTDIIIYCCKTVSLKIKKIVKKVILERFQ